ncbi:MAG: ParB/RepB/Spo0J family partition protein, partial [Planctomycetota bacterium]
PFTVDCASIGPNPYQPREDLDEAGITDLTDSIREHGVLQPVVVRRVTGGYELVAGERRWRAALRLGLSRIPAVVKEVTDDRMLEVALVENLQREDLNPIEKARAYRRFVQDLGLTHEEAARRLGKDRSTVTNQLRLLELPDDVQEMVSRGTLSNGHARALLAATGDVRRREIAERVVREGLSVRQTERLARTARRGNGSTRRVTEKSAYFEELERRLRERYATKARIDGGKQRGRITLEYYSMDELSRLLEALLPE